MLDPRDAMMPSVGHRCQTAGWRRKHCLLFVVYTDWVPIYKILLYLPVNYRAAQMRRGRDTLPGLGDPAGGHCHYCHYYCI
jgi:hypothetical protein